MCTITHSVEITLSLQYTAYTVCYYIEGFWKDQRLKIREGDNLLGKPSLKNRIHMIGFHKRGGRGLVRFQTFIQKFKHRKNCETALHNV